MDDDDRITFNQWLASVPLRPLPTYEEALRLEVAWNTALRQGRESSPPGPGPGQAEAVAAYQARMFPAGTEGRPR